MTIEEIRLCDKDFLIPKDIAEALGSDPHNIIVTARMYPERIGYPFTFVGNRMKIPKAGFLSWYCGKNA
jgi:hypothetical protein